MTANWFADRARDFKAKAKNHDAWLYYLEARNCWYRCLLWSTQVTDKLYDESQSVKPADLPRANLGGDSGKTFKLTALFPASRGPGFRSGGEVPIRRRLQHCADLPEQHGGDEGVAGEVSRSCAMPSMGSLRAPWKRRGGTMAQCCR